MPNLTICKNCSESIEPESYFYVWAKIYTILEVLLSEDQMTEKTFEEITSLLLWLKKPVTDYDDNNK